MKKLTIFLFILLSTFLFFASSWASNGNDVKWSQSPDLEYGANIQSTRPEPLVADDWKCQDPRPVTDVHFWGSYIGWAATSPDPPAAPPPVDGYIIQIFKDIPAGTDPDFPYSHPGAVLYGTDVKDFQQEFVASIKHPDETYEHKFYYSLDLPEPFTQIEGTIYLDIHRRCHAG